MEASWLLDDPINGRSFQAYVREELTATLKPGDIVVLDNLRSHKGRAVRRMIHQAGAKLFFLPAYSPDLNPIEQLFARIKHAMRKAMGRTVPNIEQEIANTLDAIPPLECRNCIHAAGYKSI
jgi:transposase